jgi:site-specific recombinase XerD
MGLLRDQMYQDLCLGGYADKTISLYLDLCQRLAKRFGRSPKELSRDELRSYVTELSDKKLSDSSLRQHFAAIKFLYEKTLGEPNKVSFLSWPARAQKLPVVLSVSEVCALLEAITSLTIWMVTATIYATGLRLFEVCQLETSDIDRKQNIIRVRLGKGKKDRNVTLCERLYHDLREYYRRERPESPYLFAASRVAGPVRQQTVQLALRRAGKAAGITKRVSPHVLRHCYTSHLLDQGVELRLIQAVLGHTSIQTTARYAHVSTRAIAKMPSPIENLPRKPR